jgi:hypothetical protein
METSRCRVAQVILLAALIFASGCNRGPTMGTVRGEVTLDGQPLKEGRVLFTPVDGQGQTGGATIADGKFTAEVPLGKMQVQINANKVVGRKAAYEGVPNSPMYDEVVELIPARYNAHSEITLEVKPGTQDAKYELKSK